MPRPILLTLFALTLPLAAAAQMADEHGHETIKIKPPEVSDTGPRPDLVAVVKGVVEKTNAFRKEQGRERVKADETLTKTAQAFAKFMAETDEYGHTADGHRPSERAKQSGYDYCIVLENIAYAFDSTGFTSDKLTEKFVMGWKNSPGHRRNMLDRDVTDTGVAVARSDTTGHYYAVQMFGRPKSAAIEFSINNQSGVDIDYTLGGSPFTLEGRYTRMHTVCRPTELKFKWPGDAGELKALTPGNGDKYKITRDGTKYAAVKE